MEWCDVVHLNYLLNRWTDYTLLIRDVTDAHPGLRQVARAAGVPGIKEDLGP